MNILITSRHGYQITCKLDIPAENPRAYALFAHCFSLSEHINAAYQISHRLALNGIACLQLDFTGKGENDEENIIRKFSHNVCDLIDISEYMEQNYEPPLVLLGHSLAGTAVLKAAGKINNSRAVITIGSPYDPLTFIELNNKNPGSKSNDEILINLGERQFKINHEYVNELKETDIAEDISKLDKALLIMHSPLDNLVSIQNASDIFSKAKHPKSFISLDKADHFISNQSDAVYIGDIISSWVNLYLTKSRIEQIQNSDDNLHNKVYSITSENSIKTDIYTGNHHLIADEPLSLGGTDMGPDPYGYLLASLGSCTTMTVMMYAKRKGWNLDEVRVKLNHTKVHASDCEECETKTGKVDYIEMQIEFRGNIDDIQKNRLTEIADKCPVHRTLHSEIVVKTTILE